MMEQTKPAGQWSFLCHLSYGDEGAIRVVRYDEGAFRVQDIPSVAEAGAAPSPVFLGTTPEDKVIVMDAESKEITLRDTYPVTAFAPYAYRDFHAAHVWFTVDGDKETGCDTLNCGTTGAPVIVLDSAPSDGGAAALLKVICVGRGHHVVTFTAPSQDFPDIPRCAFVSNLLDGSISVVGNDPAEPDSYLQVIDTIDLCEPEREKEGASGVPNNAFPHGKVFSPHSGRIYSLNNGYGTIAVIDPVSRSIEKRIELKVSSNLLLSPDGRFLIGKGADRKTDAEHVIGRLSVVDIHSGAVESVLDVPDLYPSTYRFSPDGGKLYVTSAATGKGVQRDNLRIDVLQVYDASALPALKLIREIPVGRADCGRRPIAFISGPTGDNLVLVPNPSDGTISMLAGDSDVLLQSVTVSDRPVDEFNFSFWDGAVSGC